MSKMYVASVKVNLNNIGQLGGLFDMLRYDHAKISDWTHEDGVVTLRMTSDRPFTFDRWHSFGLICKQGI